jgi:hypothetical protein
MRLTQHLTPIQQHAIALLSAGSTTTAAASSAGVHRNTIANWLRSPIFRDTLADIRREQNLAWRAQTRSLTPRAPVAVVPKVETTPRPGRNQPCPCGSGRKSKRCCGATY